MLRYTVAGADSVIEGDYRQWWSNSSHSLMERCIFTSCPEKQNNPV
jgi:hypothetical protein